MPRTWNFPRRRNLIMQIVMCALLGGTVTLAALIDRRVHASLYLPLSSPIVDGTITFRLPAGWKTSVHTDDGGSIIQTATEQVPGSGRVLSISHQRVNRIMPPVEYLHISGRLAGNLREQPADFLSIDGWPGQIMQWIGMRRTGDAPVEAEALICCVILPDYQAVTVRLERPGPMDASDRRIMREVMDALSFAGLDHPGTGRMDLGDNAWVDVPGDFTVLPQPDPLRRDRTIVMQTQPTWICAQFIPVVLGDQPVDSLRQILAADEHQDSRDPAQAKRWLGAQVSQQINPGGPNRWIIDPESVEQPELLIHHLATLTTNSKGQGMLVVLTATNPAGAQELDQVWSQLQNTIHLDGAVNLAEQLNIGAAAVAANAPLSAPSPQTPSPQAWEIWQRGESAQGWSVTTSDTTGEIRLRESCWRNWEGTITRVTERCAPLDRPGDFSILVQRADAEAEPFSRFLNLFAQSTNVSDTISTTLGTLEPTVVDRSAAFVPSMALGSWLATLPPKPLALWTDRFPGVQSELLFSPVLLLVRPIGSVPAGLHGLEVELSGTGQLSRWYFHSDGTLDHADLAGKLTIRPSSAVQIQSSMGNDPRLAIQVR